MTPSRSPSRLRTGGPGVVEDDGYDSEVAAERAAWRKKNRQRRNQTSKDDSRYILQIQNVSGYYIGLIGVNKNASCGLAELGFCLMFTTSNLRGVGA